MRKIVAMILGERRGGIGAFLLWLINPRPYGARFSDDRRLELPCKLGVIWGRDFPLVGRFFGVIPFFPFGVVTKIIFFPRVLHLVDFPRFFVWNFQNPFELGLCLVWWGKIDIDTLW